ncbi:hypothetical protein [Amycolatopsis lurida]|uniref:hypothetical protein n=1 Tax=Amycolatopsis lurida TaxID=31959 RepID=UPI000A804A49|nr:hypothetical protein [Amycolatopsis lurida]
MILSLTVPEGPAAGSEQNVDPGDVLRLEAGVIEVVPAIDCPRWAVDARGIE